MGFQEYIVSKTVLPQRSSQKFNKNAQIFFEGGIYFLQDTCLQCCGYYIFPRHGTQNICVTAVFLRTCAHNNHCILEIQSHIQYSFKEVLDSSVTASLQLKCLNQFLSLLSCYLLSLKSFITGKL